MPLTRQAKDLIQQIIATVVGFVAAFWPFGLYLLLKYSLEPQGFWQNLILVGVGMYCLGFLQIILAFLFVVWLFIVWEN